MSRILLAAAAAALLARATVFADGDTLEAFVSFAAFWVLAGSWFVSYITS